MPQTIYSRREDAEFNGLFAQFQEGTHGMFRTTNLLTGDSIYFFTPCDSAEDTNATLLVAMQEGVVDGPVHMESYGDYDTYKVMGENPLPDKTRAAYAKIPSLVLGENGLQWDTSNKGNRISKLLKRFRGKA